MKFQILICLCVGSVLASPASEVTQEDVKQVGVKHVVNELSPVQLSEVNPVPVKSVEQLIPDGHPVEAVKESLEPAATSWGPSFYSAGVGWGGFGGLGYHGYGGYGGGYRSYGGYGYRPHARYYGGGYGHYW